MTESILQVDHLTINFYTETGIVRAVDDVSFNILPGETLGLVGESGCGKSVSALSILKLIPSPPGKIERGEILWNGKDLLKIPQTELVNIRGQEISIIFQEPLTSFNPVQKIGAQISEVLQLHTQMKPNEIRERVIHALNRVGIPNPEQQYNAYPHELSGGMRQRAMIAMALICNPKLVIADEPTTALDVTIQAQILELLQELQTEYKMSVLMITHNLGIVAESAQHVAVMYAGKIVEKTEVGELFTNPLHPYTQGLLDSIPSLHSEKQLYSIPGMIPDPINLPKGCYFEPRCPKAMPVCKEKAPVSQPKTNSHHVACWLY